MAGETIEVVIKVKDEASKNLKATAKATTGVAKATKNLGERQKAAAESSKVLKDRLTLVAGAALAAGAGILKLQQDTADARNAIVDMGARTGFANRTLAGLKLAAEGSGRGFEDLNEVLNPLVAKMGQVRSGSEAAEKAFTDWGVAVRDSRGEVLSNDEVFANLVARLQSIEDPSERAAASVALLGESGGKLNQILGDAALDDFVDQAERYGLDVGPDAIAASANWQRSMADLGLVLGDATGSLSDLFGLTEKLDNFVLGFVFVKAVIEEFTAAATASFTRVGGVLDALWTGNFRAAAQLAKENQEIADTAESDILAAAEAQTRAFAEGRAKIRAGSAAAVGALGGGAGAAGGAAGGGGGGGGGGTSQAADVFGTAAEFDAMFQEVLSAQLEGVNAFNALVDELKLGDLVEQDRIAAESAVEAAASLDAFNAAAIEAEQATLDRAKVEREAAADTAASLAATNLALFNEMVEEGAEAQLRLLEAADLAASQLSEPIRKTGAQKAEGVAGALGAVQGGLQGILGALGPAGAVASGIVGVASNLPAIIDGIIDSLDDILIGLVEGLPKIFFELIPALVKAMLKDIPNAIADALLGVLEEVFPGLKGARERAESNFKNLSDLEQRFIRGQAGNILGGEQTSFADKLAAPFRNEPQQGFASGGFINQSGLKMMHRGELVVPENGVLSSGRQQQAQGGGQQSQAGSPTIIINVTGLMDAAGADRLVEELNRHIGPLGSNVAAFNG